jgi:hypothetical protein
MKSYGRDRARLQLHFHPATLCGSVQSVQKAARPAGSTREIKGFSLVCDGWHARCTTGWKIKFACRPKFRPNENAFGDIPVVSGYFCRTDGQSNFSISKY